MCNLAFLREIGQLRVNCSNSGVGDKLSFFTSLPSSYALSSIFCALRRLIGVSVKRLKVISDRKQFAPAGSSLSHANVSLFNTSCCYQSLSLNRNCTIISK